MKHGHFFIAILFTATAAFNGFAAANDDTIRKSYSASDATPDHLAFASFAEVTSDLHSQGEPMGADFLIFRFDLEQSDESRSIVEPILQIIVSANAEIKRKISASEKTNYCNLASSNPSNDVVFEAMDKQDDLNEAIMEQQYNHVLSQLSQNQKAYLVKAITSFKKGFSYTTLNHKAAWEAHDSSLLMKSKVIDICANLSGTLEGNLTGSTREK